MSYIGRLPSLNNWPCKLDVSLVRIPIHLCCPPVQSPPFSTLTQFGNLSFMSTCVDLDLNSQFYAEYVFSLWNILLKILYHWCPYILANDNTECKANQNENSVYVNLICTDWAHINMHNWMELLYLVYWK